MDKVFGISTIPWRKTQRQQEIRAFGPNLTIKASLTYMTKDGVKEAKDLEMIEEEDLTKEWS